MSKYSVCVVSYGRRSRVLENFPYTIVIMIITNVFDIANYIQYSSKEPISSIRLQKLVYYCQCWYLTWENQPLFIERIEAWANGPICVELFKNKDIQGNFRNLTDFQRKNIDRVIWFYGDRNSQWLADLIRSEAPYRDARRGLPLSERGNVEITHAAIRDYYSNL
jgi:uncharacterized phage-associated protein